MTRRATRHAPARVRSTTPNESSGERLHVARLAARIMAEEGVASPAQARAKALSRLGIPAQRDVPDNREIAAFLCEYQRLFQADSQAEALRIRRAVALQTMSLLYEFDPLVAGPVLDGSAGTRSWVSLHVFADAPEDVGIALLNLCIPYESGDKKLRRANGLMVSQPCFRFMADEVPVEIIVFRGAERHEPPLCPVLDRPMARADRRRLAGLIDPQALVKRTVAGEGRTQRAQQIFPQAPSLVKNVEPGRGPADACILRVALALPFSRLYDYLPPADCPSERLVPGHRVRVPFKVGTRIGFLIEIADESPIAPEKLRRALEVLDQAPVIHTPQLELLIWASDYYHHPLGEVVAQALPSSLRRVRAIAPRLRDTPGPSNPPALPPAAPTLTASQADAVQAITAGLDRFEVFLLEGVTGSGKTEVYLRVVEAVIEGGKQALCLVPEIGLTPQTIARFQERFAVSIATTHSGLSEAQRRAAWWMAREGLAPIVIGTRSAVWSELCRPGVIVVDEEHDLSYKQQQGFRYSARDIAIIRAKRYRCPVVLGSATPSLETLHNAAIGRYRHLRLPARVGSATDPMVEIIDLRRGTARGPLSAILIARITETLAERRQVIVFANRRGYAPLLLCPECAWAAGCDRCDARLVYHRETGRLRCHHCGADRPVPVGCPECGSAFLCKVGHGTERVVESLREHFPEARVLRIDRDAVRGQAAWERALARIAEGDADILVGTQMLAKGHHFPKVTLVAIVDGDQGLYGTDFRAGERLAQQLVQVAGRTGRAEDPGQVVIQTHNPHHPLLAVLLREGYAAFAAMALRERREAGLPPFSALALVRAEGRDTRAPEVFLQEARSLGLRETNPRATLLGPVPAPMERRADRYRWHLLVQARERTRLQSFLHAWLPQLTSLKSSRRVRWSVDVDPQELL